MTSPLLDSEGPVSVEVMANGQVVSDSVRFTRIRVQRGLRTIGRCTLRVLDDQFLIVSAGTFSIGTRVSVSAGYGDKKDPAFEGKVTSVTSELTSAGGLWLTVVVQDGGYELLRSTAIESFADVSLREIVTTLIQGAGLKVGVVDLPTTALKYALRNDTALGLIDEIAERTGRDWCIIGDTFSMWSAATGSAPGAGAVSLTIGMDVMSFSARQAGDGPTAVTVRGWDPAEQSAVVGTSKTPTSRGGFDATGGNGAGYSRVDARAATRSKADADLAAAAIAARTGRVIATGECQYTAAMVPGGRVQVNGAGPSNGNYYIREVDNTWMDGNAVSRFVAGDRDPVQLSDPWESPSPVSSFRRSGLAVGIVDKVRDPENLGRVSVSLSSADDQLTSAWARVLALGAGNNRGHVVIPEIGDEVLIGFEDDDVARPVVLGGLFGNKSKSPLPNTVNDNGAVITRAITSRLGHAFTMSDGTTPDTQHLQLALAGDKHSLRIGKDRADLKLPTGVPLKITVGESFIEFDGKGNITIDATSITLKAKSKVEVSASDVEATAKLGLKLQGTQTSLKATASGVVESSGVLEVKGAMVKIN